MTDKITEFDRIFTPRLEKAVKAVSLLANGARYKPTEKEVDRTLEALKDAVNGIAQAYGVLPAATTSEPAEVSSTGSEKRIEAKQAIIKRSPFAHEDIDANIRSIPDAQLTRYATHILARICEKWNTPEDKPKNYEPPLMS